MADRYGGRSNIEDTSELAVLLALKKNIMRDLHVGTFAIVKSVNPAKVQFFPQIEGEADKTVEVVNMAGELAQNDVVYVTFADRNFIQALRQIKLGRKMTYLNNDADLHSEKYGVIIAKLQMEEN